MPQLVSYIRNISSLKTFEGFVKGASPSKFLTLNFLNESIVGKYPTPILEKFHMKYLAEALESFHIQNISSIRYPPFSFPKAGVEGIDRCVEKHWTSINILAEPQHLSLSNIHFVPNCHFVLFIHHHHNNNQIFQQGYSLNH